MIFNKAKLIGLSLWICSFNCHKMDETKVYIPNGVKIFNIIIVYDLKNKIDSEYIQNKFTLDSSILLILGKKDFQYGLNYFKYFIKNALDKLTPCSLCQLSKDSICISNIFDGETLIKDSHFKYKYWILEIKYNENTDKVSKIDYDKLFARFDKKIISIDSILMKNSGH